MKRLFALLLFAALAVLHAPVEAQQPPQSAPQSTRVYSQGELDALLAPIALHPDAVLSNVLVAASYPDDIRDAAAWARGNPQLSGEAAVRAIDPYQWHPAVKALVAFPELLERMAESPQWTADLGAAFVVQEPQVMETVQALRRRAQASGWLRSNDEYSIQQQGQAITIYPAQPQVVYVPYYDPYVVYGPWWWYSYRPVYWRPWYARPAVFVSATFVRTWGVDWHRRQIVAPAASRVVVRQQIAPVTVHNHFNPSARPIVQGAQLPRQEPRREFRDERRGEWRQQQQRDQRTEVPRQQASVQQPRPQQRVEAPRQTAQVQQRPVVVQQRMHEAQAPRSSFQSGGGGGAGGRVQSHGQGQQRGGGQGNHRGGRG